MVAKTFKFSKADSSVTDGVCQYIRENTEATATVRFIRSRVGTGILQIQAGSQEKLDVAVRYVSGHKIYREHFRAD
jgi:hypothetical protein